MNRVSEPTPRGQGTERKRRWKPRRFPHLPPLSPTARILLLILGWILIVLGVLGLVLPILQGWLGLALGAAALSLVSKRMLDFLRYLFRPWPAAWRSILRSRRRVLHWIKPKKE